MKLFIGVQARTNSTRFPKKIYQTLGDKPLIRWSYDAAKAAERIIRASKVDVTTAICGFHGDEELKQFCHTHLMTSFFPPFVEENDLISRYLKVVQNENFTHFIRLTADCWALNPALISTIAELLKDCDYASNTIHRSFPEGLDVQGGSLQGLKWFDRHQKEEREHPFAPFEANDLIRKEFLKANLSYRELVEKANPLFVKTSIDTEEDLKKAQKLYDEAQKHRHALDRESEKRTRSESSRNELQTLDSVR